MADPVHAVVIGAGVAGLGAALALAHDGHRVTVVERDATPLPADPASAFAWDRRGAPQVRHSHAFLALMRNLLRDRYPQVLAALLEAGATEMRFCEMMPPEMGDTSPRDGDDDLVALACRRTTFEWVLRRSVLADPLVTILDGAAIEDLLVDGAPTPTVTGVRISRGGTTDDLDADVVVAATGRRSSVARWLAAHGVTLDVTEEDTGIIYFSRFYALRPGSEAPAQEGPIGGDLGYLKYAVFQGDNRTYSVTFAVRTDDDVLRSTLLEPATFDRAAAVLPGTAAWVDASLAEPITEVHVMGGLLNRRIGFVDESGDPLVLGLSAIGDAHTCTNPLYGRGCSLAMVQATLFADALAAHPHDARARSHAYEGACDREILPWYQAALASDRYSRKQAEADAMRGDNDDVSANAKSDPDPETFAFAVLRDGLMPAVRTDPDVFRAFIRAFNLLDAPDALLANTHVMAKVLAMYQDRDQRPPDPDLGPDRRAMLERLDVS